MATDLTTFSVDVPTALVSRVTAALCAAGGYPVSVENARQAVIDYITATVLNVEQSRAEQAAVDAVNVTEITGLT